MLNKGTLHNVEDKKDESSGFLPPATYLCRNELFSVVSVYSQGGSPCGHYTPPPICSQLFTQPQPHYPHGDVVPWHVQTYSLCSHTTCTIGKWAVNLRLKGLLMERGFGQLDRGQCPCGGGGT